MKLLHTRISPGLRAILIDSGLLALRLSFGSLMALQHGLVKLQAWSEKADSFPDPLGIGHPLSMACAIGAEFFCSIFVILGLFTRVAVLPLMFTMGVAFLIIHGDDPFKKMELAVVYFSAFTTLLLAGPGRFSIDDFIFTRPPAKAEK